MNTSISQTQLKEILSSLIFKKITIYIPVVPQELK
jgi:hypothetical protein